MKSSSFISPPLSTFLTSPLFLNDPRQDERRGIFTTKQNNESGSLGKQPIIIIKKKTVALLARCFASSYTGSTVSAVEAAVAS